MVFIVVEVASQESVGRRILGQFATDAQVAAYNHEHGYDRPAPVRFLEFARNAVTLDFGVSILTNEPVLQTIKPRLGRTLLLAGIAFIVIMPLAVLVGIMSAL